MIPLLDPKQRPLRSLRLSVTDRCNLRCDYCMPEEHYSWLPKSNILTFEELLEVVELFVSVGVSNYRITGGEPLLRRNLPHFIEQLHHTPGVQTIALTTNGVLLPNQARDLKSAGLNRLTISLDTLRPARFLKLNRRDLLSESLLGVIAAKEAGFTGTKLNVVVQKGVNDDELPSLLTFGQEHGLEVRFIEYMDVGGATRWGHDRVVSQREILELLQTTFGPITAVPNRGSSPAQRFTLPDGTIFGVIASTTEPFCAQCDRIRLTADGSLLPCLYATSGLDLRSLIRSGLPLPRLQGTLARFWETREDQGAVDRLQSPTRGPLVSLPSLQKNPHLEMHTRGG